MHRIQSSAKLQTLQKDSSRGVLAATSPTLRAPTPNAPTPPLGPTNTQTSHDELPLHHSSTSTTSGGASNIKAASATNNVNTKAENEKAVVVEPDPKPPWSTRMKNGSIRFCSHTKEALFHSWINVLLVFVPIGIAMNWVPMSGTAKPTVVFAMNSVAIIPLAGLLSHATESVASRMGDTWASLLNVTFGNAVELIIFIALTKNEIQIVQASILGSILANLLLILGMAFLFGGLRFQEQIYNSTVTQMSACLLSLAVTSLLLPTAFHASFLNNTTADYRTTQISRGTSVVLLIVYALYLVFQLRSHAYMYESTPQHVIDEESHPGVLAEMLNSSSDSSSSSSSDSDDSIGSHGTARDRFRRAFKSRRRRKSNASSLAARTESTASGITTPTEERKVNLAAPMLSSQRQRYINTQDVFSGDEGDTDGDNDRTNGVPRARDFEATRISRSARKNAERKQEKKNRRKKHAKHVLEDEQNTAERGETEKPSRTRIVNFAEDPAQPPSNPVPIKRTSGLRSLARTGMRPPIPSLLSNTVFSHQQQTQHAGTVSIHSHLRRTNSLPDLRKQPVRSRSQTGGVSQVPLNEPTQRPFAINEADAIAIDAAEEGKPLMSRTAAVMLLLISTGLVAFCAELLVDAIPGMIANTTVSQTFIGLIILPIVGNAAEHVTAVTVATKNKMDLAIGVAIGSSIQIALFVTPFVVILGWIMHKDMSLYFNLFETVSLFVSVFVINFLILDGRSNYLEGSLLIAAYVIIAVAAFFYPNVQDESQLGGGEGQASLLLVRSLVPWG